MVMNEPMWCDLKNNLYANVYTETALLTYTMFSCFLVQLMSKPSQHTKTHAAQPHRWYAICILKNYHTLQYDSMSDESNHLSKPAVPSFI